MMNMSIKDEYYTLGEAANELDVTRQTLFRWIKAHKYKVEKIGRETLIERKVIDEQRAEKYFDQVSAIVSWLLDADNYKQIREQGNYTDEDKIEILNDEEQTFLVTKKDGSRDMVVVGGTTINYDEKNRKLDVTIDKGGVEITPYKERRKSRESKTPK
jgi:excisionase family DNA binding protein